MMGMSDEEYRETDECKLLDELMEGIKEKVPSTVAVIVFTETGYHSLKHIPIPLLLDLIKVYAIDLTLRERSN